MIGPTLQRRLLVLIAAATVLTGLVQIVAPGFVLRLLSADAEPTSRHLFAIVGMFMCLFGGALLHALADPARNALVVLWASLQKLGAAAAVLLGVMNALFSPLALLVAGFDLFSGVLGLWYWSFVRSAAP